MIERVGNYAVECRNGLNGYSIEVNGKQVYWVSHKEFKPELKAEVSFSSIVSTLKQI